MLSEDTIILFGITPGMTNFQKVHTALKVFMKEKKEIDYNDRFNIIFFTKEGPKYFEDFTLKPSYLLDTLSEHQSEIIKADIAGGIFIAAMYVVEVFKRISGKCFRMIILSDGESKKIPDKQMPFLSDLLEKITDMPFIMDAVRIDGEDPRDDLRLMKLARRTGGDLYEIDEIFKEHLESKNFREKEEKSVIAMLEKLSRTPLNLAKRLKKDENNDEITEEEEEFRDLIDVLKHLKSKKKVESELFEVENIKEIAPNKKVFYEGLADPLKPVTEKENKKCIICFTSLKNHELFQCPNCHNSAHKICLAIWSKESNIGIPNLFRCPNCYNLLQIDRELIQKINRVNTPTIEVCEDMEDICLEEYLKSLESPEGPKIITSEEGNLSADQNLKENSEENGEITVVQEPPPDPTIKSQQKDSSEAVSIKEEELKMIWCPECGKMITNEYIKCPACGYNLKKQQTSTKEIPKKKTLEDAEILSQISELKVKEKSDFKAKKFNQAIAKAEKIIALASQIEKSEIAQAQHDFIERVERERDKTSKNKEFNRKYSYLKTKINRLFDQNQIAKANREVEDFYSQNKALISSQDKTEFENFRKKIAARSQEKALQSDKKDFQEEISGKKDLLTEGDIWKKLDEKEGEMKAMMGEIMKLNEAREESSHKLEEHQYAEAIDILNSALDEITSDELAEYRNSLKERKAEIQQKQAKYEQLSQTLSQEREKYEKNLQAKYFHAALYNAQRINQLAVQLRKTDLAEEFTENEKELEKKIANNREKFISESDQLKNQLQELDETIRIEYFDDDLLPLVQKYHLDELELKKVHSEKIIEIASHYLNKNRKKMENTFWEELIIVCSSSEVRERKKELAIKKIEKNKKIQPKVFKKTREYQCTHQVEVKKENITELTIDLQVPYYFNLTSLHIGDNEFINLAIKQPTPIGLKYSFNLEALNLKNEFTIAYRFNKRISRILLFTKDRYLYMIKCFYNISFSKGKPGVEILLPFEIKEAEYFNWLIIEDIFPLNFSPLILEPNDLRVLESSLSDKGRLVGWILKNLAAGTHLFQYYLLSPERLAKMSNQLIKKLQNSIELLNKGNFIDFKKNMGDINAILDKELK